MDKRGRMFAYAFLDTAHNGHRVQGNACAVVVTTLCSVLLSPTAPMVDTLIHAHLLECT